MGVGQRLKEMRSKAGMTQKDLADELHVTYQAVSRWENDDAEPSFDTVKEICRIFHCTSDDLFGIERDNPAQPESTQPIAEKPQVVEKVIIQESKPVLGVCEQCNKPIYDPEDLRRIDVTHTVRHGPSHHTTHRDMILCNACNEKRLQQKKAAEVQKVAMEKSNEKKRRVHSFVWSTLSAILFLVIAIVCFVKGYTTAGYVLLGTGFVSFPLLAMLILNNTFITEMWMEIASWGFVKLPGVIFSLDFDGLAFLIAVKILFFILGISLAILSFLFASALAGFLSIFVYPHALKKNLEATGSI